MALPASTDEFLDLVRKSGVTDEKRFADYVTKGRAAGTLAPDASRMAGLLVRDGILTQFQAEQILQGKWRRFTIGKYKVLERIGVGGMGSVYLCEHKLMRRRVAVKVLPTAKANDPSALERFYREARAVAALDHANIVHAYDIDQDDQLHFLVMEYVDGSSFQDIIKKHGPMDLGRACHYMQQALLGLEHAHLAGLVHRDIKPGNILVDRTGLVKILDMGLARFFNDEDDILTKKYDENVLGTADYLAPEQAMDSHSVDIRADIYSLGATFYFILTGRTPFGEGTVAQKLLWHQTRQPKPVSEYRKETPPELVAIISKMMAKDMEQRYQKPIDVAEALAPFAQGTIGPPPESEMPNLSPAALGIIPQDAPDTAVTLKAEPAVPRALQAMGSSTIKRNESSGSKPSLANDTAPTANANTTPISSPPRSRPPESNVPAAVGAGSSVRSGSMASKPASPVPQPRATVAPPRPAPPPQPPAIKELPPKSAPKKPTLKVEEPQFSFESMEDSSEPGPQFAPDSEPTTTPSRKKLTNAAKGDPRTRRMMIYSVGAFGLLVVASLVAWLAITQPWSKPLEPVGRKPLDVTSDGTKVPRYSSILQAIGKAQKGDVILLHDEIHAENIDLDFNRLTNFSSELTIQAAPGKQVKWISKFKTPEQPIIILRHAANFKIQGPGLTLDGTMDGKQRVKRLVEVYARSPGLTIDKVRFQSFDVAGLQIFNSAGEDKRPMRFLNLEFTALAGENPQAAVVFDANPAVSPTVNDFLEFVNPIFNGPKIGFLLAKPKVNGDHVKGVDGAVEAKKK